MIKAIFFDASETLIHLPDGVAWHYAHVAARHGLQLDEIRLHAAFRAAWKAAPAEPATRIARPDDSRGWWRELVRTVLAEVTDGCPPSNFEVLFADLYHHFTEPGVWELYPDVLPTLRKLRARFALGIISNFDGRLRKVLRQLRVLDCFDTVVISSEAGADKPDPFIFEEALRRLHVSANEAVHAGDDPIHDWQGAASAGMKCFRLQRPQNSLADLPHWLGGL